ncbi:MAG: hypothetical protein GSR79_00420 [Desulfurococcales archaeon]|nr:hypothetical protein [Desulfurococcales archaeon]
MIIISGSKLVKDSKEVNDIDVVYVTFNPVRYIALLLAKKTIENKLTKRVGVHVSFSPYLLLAPTVFGNIFIGITLLRYPFEKASWLLKLSTSIMDLRWLKIHAIYAFLGLVYSDTCRNQVKYCSMISENLLYICHFRIPNSWYATIGLSQKLALKKELYNLYRLFTLCLNSSNIEEKNINCLNDLEKIIPDAFHELIDYYTKVNYKCSLGVLFLDKFIGKGLRRLHTELYYMITGRRIEWIYCSSLFLALVPFSVFKKIFVNEAFRHFVKLLYKYCKKEIPVLSPLAHP